MSPPVDLMKVQRKAELSSRRIMEFMASVENQREGFNGSLLLTLMCMPILYVKPLQTGSASR